MFKLTDEREFVTDENVIECIIGSDTFETLKNLKNELVLDLLLPSFEHQYFDINELLMK